GDHAAVRGQHDGGAGAVPAGGPVVVADAQAGHVQQGVGVPGPHDRVRVRNRLAASANTRVQRTISSTSTYSSAWWAIHLPPGPYTTEGMPPQWVSTVPSVEPGTPP